MNLLIAATFAGGSTQLALDGLTAMYFDFSTAGHPYFWCSIVWAVIHESVVVRRGGGRAPSMCEAGCWFAGVGVLLASNDAYSLVLR